LQERIAVEKAKLEEERRSLAAEEEEIEKQRLETGGLDSAITGKRALLGEAEDRVGRSTKFGA